MTIIHSPTQKTYTVKFQRENKHGLWYFTTLNIWVWAGDCVVVK